MPKDYGYLEFRARMFAGDSARFQVRHVRPGGSDRSRWYTVCEVSPRTFEVSNLFPIVLRDDGGYPRLHMSYLALDARAIPDIRVLEVPEDDPEGAAG